MSLKLLRNNILLEPLPVQTRSSGGIHLPQEQVGDQKLFWKVTGVGPGKAQKDGTVLPMEISVGDTVITPLHFSHTSLEDGSNRKIVDCEQVIGKLDPTPDLRVV